MELFEICRVCVEEVNEYWFLFDSCYMMPWGSTTPARIITEFTSIEMERDDGLPEYVCNNCLEAVASGYRIREMCISSDRKLRKLVLQNKGPIVQQAFQPSNQIIQRKNELEAHEAADKEDSNDNNHTGSDDSSEIKFEESESISYGETPVRQYLTNVQQQNEAVGEHEVQPISVDSDPDNSINNQTIVLHVQILKNKDSEVSVQVEPWENSPNISQSHANDDSKEKIACDLCGKHFSTKGNLKAHILLHSNHKPFRCELCGEEFSRKHNYNVHKLRHTGKRIHQCPKCDKSFVCSVNLKHHMIKHADVKPFKCKRCAIEFSYRTDLARHEVTHTGIYPFACEFCQHKFTRKCSLLKHLPKCMRQTKKRSSKEKSGIQLSKHE